MGLRESVERGLSAPGSHTLEQVQHGVISLSAVPTEVGLSMGAAFWNFPPGGHEGPDGPREGMHAYPPSTQGGVLGAQATEVRPRRQDPALRVTSAIMQLPAPGGPGKAPPRSPWKA